MDGTELRIALGMRGGVSLAVWMGGACSEVDRLRRARERKRPEDDVYRWLLDGAGYSRVTVDVLAGASAGGLNGVLMSCSVVHGMDFGSNIRNLWLQVGDLGALVRRGGGRRPESLLDGDRNFYGTLADKLPELVRAGKGTPEGPTPRLDTILTCTLLSPALRRRFQDLGPPIDESRNRAWFRFRSPGPDETGSDFGQPRGNVDAALRRLAYAARATSSFPGAFEAASVGFAKDSSSLPSDGGGVPLPETHYGIYSESRPRTDGTGPGRDRVIDGGVLDNIPLAWAVRAIAAAPADCPVDRWLLYLQPVPFAPPTAGRTRQPRTFDVVHRARDLKSHTEALADDLDELQRLRRDGQRRRAFAQVLEYALGQLPTDTSLLEFLGALSERGLAARERYRERAGEIEAGRIRELWTDPLAVLGADPLGFRDTTREPLAEAHADMLDVLPRAAGDLVLDPPGPENPPAADKDDQARQVIADLAGELARFRSPQVLARTVSVLLDGARELGTAGLELKKHLYGIRREIEILIAHADRRLAAAPSTLRETPGTSDALVAFVRATLPHGGPPGWFGIWTDLVEAAQQLAEVAQKAAHAGDVRKDERAFLGCLVKAATYGGDPDTGTRAVLAAVEFLTGPLRPDPLAETTPVKFHMISAVNGSPWVPDDGNPAAAGKLAGNQLHNFAAFLSARWRLNDWTWGRLDASSSLVDVLLRRFGTPEPSETDAQRDERLRREDELCDSVGVPRGSSREDVRRRCVTLLHEGVLREELPLFRTVRDRPPTEKSLDVKPLGAHLTPDPAPLLEVGREGLRDVAKRSLTRVPTVLRLLRVGVAVAADGVGQSIHKRADTVSEAMAGKGR